MAEVHIRIRPMTIADYDKVYALWEHIEGFALRSVDDSRAGIARFLERNPNTSFVAEAYALTDTPSTGREQPRAEYTGTRAADSRAEADDIPANTTVEVSARLKEASVKDDALPADAPDGTAAARSTVDDSGTPADLVLRDVDTLLIPEAPRIVGTILCGHDGRQASFYHVCVAQEFRQHGIATRMVYAALDAVRDCGISKVTLIAFKSNTVGNVFWGAEGWEQRKDYNPYEYRLNPDNTITYV